ncbi:MAG: hypothetical protein GC134_09595 [Proteobacteria bacterium]|nr:hypothetical protein [Pseudomonadota bacterium]
MYLARTLGTACLCALISVNTVWAEDQHAAPHWGYDGAGAPVYWGDLDESFKTCTTGNVQSPVDIRPNSEQANLSPLTLNYKTTGMHILNNGHTVQLNYDKGSTMQVGNDVYDLVQLHFHTPSENLIDGKRFPMEMHLVHKRGDGTLGVLGVMIQEGRANTTATRIWDNMPMQQQAETTIPGSDFNVLDLIPGDLHYYGFMGSLTTPPCTEGVHWHVLQTPITFSAEQIEQFRKAFAMNARPPQHLNGRPVATD